MELVLQTQHPIFSIVYSGGNIAASSWFFIHGTDSDGNVWKVEHQGMVLWLEIDEKEQHLYFAGDDQNDFTDSEPIGCLEFDKELIEVDKSELTLWFEQKEVTTKLSADQIYSDDTKMTELMSLDSGMKSKDLAIKDEEFTNLLDALGDIIEDSDYSEKISNDSELDDDSLLGELLDDVIKNKPMVANAGNDMTYHSGDDDFAVIILDGIGIIN
jgi:hypothetical protein